MKIAVIGGGSTYSPELAHGLAERHRRLGLEELSLFDIDPERLDVVGGFVERMVGRMAPSVRVQKQPQLRDALAGADFVVLQIRVGGQKARLDDERLGKHHGVIGQETTGVGGLAKALRTIPEALSVADAMQAACPSATLINFTNPVSIVTEALLQHGPVRTIGLCNIPISQRAELAGHLGVSAEQVEIDSVGLNHLSFIRGVRVGEKEVLPELIAGVARLLASGHRPANIPDLDFPAELLTSLGMIPSDYLRYFFLQRETVEEQQAKSKTRAEEVMAIEEELLQHYADRARDERPEALTKRGGAFYSHAALEIIEAMAGNHGDRLIVDTQNGDCVPELPADCCVEVPCRVDAQGAHPLPQAPLEPPICGLIQHVKSYEALAVRAALSRQRRDLYLALISHPLTRSADDASRVVDALIERLGWA